MNTKLSLLASVVFLAAVSICLGQPVITNQPATQATAPGTTATLQVGATGTAPLAYQWQRNMGAGFSDMAGCTNLALVLTNVQSWDAWDYRAVVTNPGGAQTSTVAHLYVMSPGLLTDRVVVDNFDDNHPTGWSLLSGGQLRETNQQLTVSGYWPGRITHNPPDTAAFAALYRSWSVGNCQTLEWRAELVGMNQGATAALVEVVNSASGGTYVMFKGRDFIKINKYIVASGGPAHFLYETTSLPSSNIVLALALTRVSQDLILTARVLDKANHNAVLYERSVVDTPRVDRSLTEAEQQAASGMLLHAVSDIPAPPWFSGDYILLNTWQDNYDGHQPVAEVTFDNCELWTYRVPTTRFVDVSSVNPTPPYTNWATAASSIQDAVDAAAPGDEVVVTNGIYATGGRAVGTNLLVNRVAVDKPLTLRSINGPQFTVIQGYQVPGTTNGDSAVRCMYLASDASLSGFTLTGGATRAAVAVPDVNERSGGGVWCESRSAVVSNCVLAGSSAGAGGGAWSGTLNNCTLIGNSATGSTLRGGGGGAYDSILNGCTLKGNAAEWAGGAVGVLNNCTLAGNSAFYYGGGAYNSMLNNCTLTGNSAGAAGGGAHVSTLNNCILYFNTATNGPNYLQDQYTPMNYCCTTPIPNNGVGNITNAPRFLDCAGGNLRLQSNSPCINAGRNAFVPGSTDLDGHPRIVGGTVDMGAYEFQSPSSAISYAWLQQYELPFDGSADFTDDDADGMNNWQEWRCRTDPTNALSVLRLLSPSPSGTNVTVSWQSMEGVSYFLERSTNLSATPSFTLLAPALPGEPGTVSFTDTNAASLVPLFYRVGVGD